MPVLSHGVVARTFYSPVAAAACCCCLLKCVAHPWTLKGGVKPRQGKPSSVMIIYWNSYMGTSMGQQVIGWLMRWSRTDEEMKLVLSTQSKPLY